MAPKGNQHARKGAGGRSAPVFLFAEQVRSLIALGGKGGARSQIVRDVIDFAAAHAAQFNDWRETRRGGVK